MTNTERDFERSVDILAGRNPVREALEQEPSSIEKIMIQKGAGGDTIAEIRRLAQASSVQIQYVPPSALNRHCARGVHQGVVAKISSYRYYDLDDLLSKVASSLDEVKRQKPILVILDHLTDVHNYGAILRSCAGAGVHGVIVPSSNMAPINSATRKASAGLLGRVPIARTDSLVDAITNLKERGYWVYGTDGKGDETVWEANWDVPTAVVIGSEGVGIGSEVRRSCDRILTIPLSKEVESLNASVAAGITLFTARHIQRAGWKSD